MVVVRASTGTLATLGLVNVKVLERPYTAYILQYSESGCLGECLFCTQGRLSNSSKDLVSRVSWPKIELEILVNALKTRGNVFSRICVQNVIKDGFKEEFIKIVKWIRDSGIDIPISASLTPVNRSFLQNLKKLGVDYVGIGLDASSLRVFSFVRKPYTWDEYLKFINGSIDVFGKERVVVHIIYGIGESDIEFINIMRYLKSLGVTVALFAFTPVRGTPLESLGKPDINSYRKMQLVRYLLSRAVKIDDYICCIGNKVYLRSRLLNNVIEKLDENLEAFVASGCPGCNRPFYNEDPGGPYYNYPSLKFLEQHKAEVIRDLKELLSESDACE